MGCASGGAFLSAASTVSAMSVAGIEIRRLTLDDVDAVCEVQRHAYRDDYLESAESFVAKIAAAPETCFGAFARSDNGDHLMVGYLICLPCDVDFEMPLDAAPHGVLPLAEARSVYVHDLAVRRDRQGQQVGDLLWAALGEAVRHSAIVQFALVSVQNSTAYWQARGFSMVGPAPAGYGDEAVKMIAAVTF